MSNRPYFTLLIRTEGQWAIEFGDYDKECVKEEMEDMLYSVDIRDGGLKRKDCRIIKTASDTQAAIQQAVDMLNANWRNA